MKLKDLETLKKIIQLDIDAQSRQLQQARVEEEKIRLHRENHHNRVQKEQDQFRLDTSAGVGIDHWIRWARRASGHFERAENQINRRIEKMVDGLTDVLSKKEAYDTIHQEMIMAQKNHQKKIAQDQSDERSILARLRQNNLL
jgi:hypothetical protein